MSTTVERVMNALKRAKSAENEQHDNLKRARGPGDEIGIVTAADLIRAERPHSEELAVVAAPNPQLTPEQMVCIERNRRDAETRLRRAQAARVVERAPEHSSRRGANDQAYSYNEIGGVINTAHRAFGLGLSHTIRDRTCKSYEFTDEKGNNMVAVTATAVAVITVTFGSETTVHEAIGGSVMHTRPENSLKAEIDAQKSAESDAFKRAARFFGPAFSTAPSPGPARIV